MMIMSLIVKMVEMEVWVGRSPKWGFFAAGCALCALPGPGSARAHLKPTHLQPTNIDMIAYVHIHFL